MLGWQDVRQTYRRSPIGPFWVTITTGVQIVTMGFVFGLLFKIPYHDYLPYLAIGILVWNFMSAAILDSSTVFVNLSELVKQIKLPVYVYVIRLLWRAFVIFLHNIVLIPIMFLVLQVQFTWLMFMALVGIFLVVINLAWIIVALGIVATRYRDFAQLTASLLTVLFYVTPVMWKKEGLALSRGAFLVEYNPFSIYLSLIREPLLGAEPPIQNWIGSVLLAIVGWAIAGIILKRYAHRVVYWL